jgi:hypothetical protein
MLKRRYGFDIGSTHVIVGETPSKLHWLLQGGKHVHKDKCGDHWEWVEDDDTPVGQKRKLGGTRSDPLKQLQLLNTVTQLGTRWLAVQNRDPEAFSLMLSQLEELEKGKKEEEGNPIQESTCDSGRGWQRRCVKVGDSSSHQSCRLQSCSSGLTQGSVADLCGSATVSVESSGTCQGWRQLPLALVQDGS